VNILFMPFVHGENMDEKHCTKALIERTVLLWGLYGFSVEIRIVERK